MTRVLCNLCVGFLLISTWLNLIQISNIAPTLQYATVEALGNNWHGIPGTRRDCYGLIDCAHEECEVTQIPSVGTNFASFIGNFSCVYTTSGLLRAEFVSNPLCTTIGAIALVCLFFFSFLLYFHENNKLFDWAARISGFISTMLLIAHRQFDEQIDPVNHNIQLVVLGLFLLVFLFGDASSKKL